MTMTNIIDDVTILKCREPDKQATKEFTRGEDGSIEKLSFSAGKFFTYKVVPVSGLRDMYELLESLLGETQKFIIRGKPKEQDKNVVYRRIHGEGSAFDVQPRHWVMLDIDKVEIPQHFNPTTDPVAVVEWVLSLLPPIFQGATCIYKFSSSQNVYDTDDQKTVSIHLVFWCDRTVTESEWKRYFKQNPSPVDQALFSAVQIHYTAAPVFNGMDDPLPERIGIFEGERDTVAVPEIPEPEVVKPTERPEQPPRVGQDAQDKAVELLLPYYDDGSRNRLIGAIAGALYRGGWEAENAADFVWQLAEADGDEGAMTRHDSALRICEAIDEGRPAQGIPTLREEFEIERLDEILSLLGVGEPDIEAIIEALSNTSTTSEIKNAIRHIARLPVAERTLYLDEIQEKTKKSKGSLNKILTEEIADIENAASVDSANAVAEEMLALHFEGDRRLIRVQDGNFWRFVDVKWAVALEDFLFKLMLPFARSYSDNGRHTASNLLNAALNILKGRVFRDGDLLRLTSDPPMVINCRNGELWYDENGQTTFKPHCPESYLRHCIDVDYDPEATCPMFREAVMEIFSESSNPEEMYRHMMEIIGYICQTWRKLAIILMLHGSGSNGKTSLMSIVERLVGKDSIMSDRISEIETDRFKIGALDGKLLLIDDDVDSGTCLPDGFLKKISEQKTLTGQHKYKAPFQFISRAVPLMLANAYPSLKDISYGIKRRMMIVPFNRRFTPDEIIPGLFDQIWEEEASGILNEVIAGFQRLKARGQFDEPADCLRAKQEWLVRSNVLVSFVEEHCRQGADEKQNVMEFYERFREFCEDHGVKRTVMTLQGVKTRLESMGYDIGILNGYTVIRGLYAPGWSEIREQEEEHKIDPDDIPEGDMK